MQWANARNGGFSPAEKTVLPVVSGGEYGYEKVNVAAEERDAESFLNWTERMTRLRLRCPEFGTSQCEWLETSDPAVLAHCCQGEKSTLLAVHNLSGREVEVTIKVGRKLEGLFDLVKNCEDPVDGDGRQRFRLEPYGYRWMRERRGAGEGGGAIID
jgi:maltose alpha-D-glucosyltransferase / alpha-amylase